MLLVVLRLLLLDVREDAGRRILLYDIDELVDLLPKTEHRQVAHSVEQVVVERSPLVYLDLFLISGRRVLRVCRRVRVCSRLVVVVVQF